MGILTDTDLKLISKDHVKPWFSMDDTRREVARIQSEVSDFAECAWGRAPMVDWVAEALDILSEGRFSPHLDGKIPIKTMADLKSAWVMAVQGAWEDRVEAWDGEPRNEHPWSTFLIDRCNVWFTLTPYQVWMFVRSIYEWIDDHMRENIFCMIKGRNGQDFTLALEKFFSFKVRTYTPTE